MIIEKRLISESLYKIKSPYVMKPIYITIHNTANTASAENEYAYAFLNAGKIKTTGWHVAVDDVKAIQAIPFNRNAWHAGDGGTGKGNRESIGIEICYSTDYQTDRFYKSMENAVDVVVQIMKEFNIPFENIKQHYDWSKKDCPHRIRKENLWSDFLNKVSNKLEIKKEDKKMDKFIEGYQVVSWLGKSIHVFKQLKNSKVGLISGDEYNQRKLLSDFNLPGKKIQCLTNASYFIDNPKSTRNGEVGGREQSFTRDDRPEQKEWFDLIIKDDLEMIFGDIPSWEYPKSEVILGLSPAVAILIDGQDVTYVSSAAGHAKYTKPYPQTLLMQNYNNDIVLAVTKENLTGEQCRNFAKANGMKHCFMLDSGGSSQMIVEGEWKARTGRTLPNALCIYSDADTAEVPNHNAEYKSIGKITVHRIGLHIRNHLLFAKRKPIGNRVGFIGKGETVEVIDFIPGLQSDGFQWVKVKWGNGAAYAQYDSTCYTFEIYK